MYEEFIFKACKSFRRRVDTIIEKMAAIVCKFTILCLNFFFCKLKLILFFNSVVFNYTRIFLILLPHPVYLKLFNCVQI